MRLLFLLAAVLLVPIVMKFQQREYLRAGGGRDRMLVGVMDILKEHGAHTVQAEVKWFDVILEGEVRDEKGRAAIKKAIEEKFPALRLLPENNRLAVKAWFVMEQVDGPVTLRGVLPQGWADELLINQADAVRENLQVSVGSYWRGDPVLWGLFVDRYFEAPGERSLQVRDGELHLKGEATPKLKAQWLDAAERLAEGREIHDDFVMAPSVWHFRGRELESKISGTVLLDLQKALAATEIRYAKGSSELPEGELGLSSLAGVLQQAPPHVRFVIGGRAERDGLALARERVAKVYRWLLAHGISAKRLEKVEFEELDNAEDSAGLVQILIR